MRARRLPMWRRNACFLIVISNGKAFEKQGRKGDRKGKEVQRWKGGKGTRKE